MHVELIEALVGCQLVSGQCHALFHFALRRNEAQHSWTGSFCYDDIISYVIRYGENASWRSLFFLFLICDAILFTRGNKSSLSLLFSICHVYVCLNLQSYYHAFHVLSAYFCHQINGRQEIKPIPEESDAKCICLLFPC